MAHDPGEKAGESNAPDKGELAPAPAKVDINPVAHDQEISQRIQGVLDATGWFVDPEVDKGVVFLNGGGKVE